MALTRDEMLQKLFRSYAGSYDIEEDVHEDAVPALTARAHFHVEESQYMLSKKAVMYSTTSDEYVWFFSVPHLTEQECSACIAYAWNQGLPLARQDGKQMVTRVVALFLCDEADDAAVTCVKSCRYYKSFQFSLKGWCECHAVAADLGKESAVSNRYGRETAKHLKKLMHPPRTRAGGNGLMRFLMGKH